MKNWQPLVLGPLLACAQEGSGRQSYSLVGSAANLPTILLPAAVFEPDSTGATARLSVAPTMLSRPGPVCLAMKFSSLNREP